MRRTACLGWLAAIVAGSAIGLPVFAQDSCRFTHRTPQVGEQRTQAVRFAMDMVLTTRQQGQVVGSSEQTVHRRQNRRLTILESTPGRVSKVKVTYDVAEQAVAQKGEPNVTVPQPVAGKTYIVARVDGELIVTDEQGRTPPPDELALVAAGMDAIGQANPLAQFLHGRSIAVGATVRLPNELAADLLGVGGAVGKVTRFELRLNEIRPVDGMPCAVFQTRIDAERTAGDGMAMQMQGLLVIEVDTCRTVAIDFSGPASMTETRGPADFPFTVTGQGTLKVAIETRPAKRRL